MALNDITEQTTTQQILNLTSSINKIKQQRDVADQLIEAIAAQLGIDFTGDTNEIHSAIADLKSVAHQLQSDAINTNIGELRSERDYYRGILDKLCDRLNVKDIEELEHVAIHQEMSLNFIDQHNDELQEQLANSQAMELKHTGRIFELERRVRSLERPELDRLSDIETTKLIRVLLSAIP